MLAKFPSCRMKMDSLLHPILSCLATPLHMLQASQHYSSQLDTSLPSAHDDSPEQACGRFIANPMPTPVFTTQLSTPVTRHESGSSTCSSSSSSSRSLAILKSSTRALSTVFVDSEEECISEGVDASGQRVWNSTAETLTSQKRARTRKGKMIGAAERSAEGDVQISTGERCAGAGACTTQLKRRKLATSDE